MPPEEDRIKKSDMRLSGERWCEDCPDRDACVEEPCDIVRLIAKIQSKQYTNLPKGNIMSSANNSTAKPTAPKTDETVKPTEASVPAQKVTADTKLKAVQEPDSGTDVNPDGETDNRTSVTKLKGLLKRNTKLILVSAALVAATVVLRAIKSQQTDAADELEVVETPAV